MHDESANEFNAIQRSDQAHGVNPPHKTTPEELAAFWAKMDAQGKANMDAFEAENDGHRKNTNEPDPNAPTWEQFDKLAGLSNTPAQSSAVPVPGFPELMATVGIDWWEWTASVEFVPSQWNALRTKLDVVKKMCQEQRLADAWVLIRGLEKSFRIGRTGFNRGGDRGDYFEYKLFYCGIPFGLANRQGTIDGISNLCVVQRGSECLRMGATSTQDRIRMFVQSLGGTIVREQLSRVDICLDVPNLDISTFRPFIQNRQFVTRAKTIQPYENAATDEWTGFVVGKRPIRIVVYDKVRELENKQDELYRQAMIERRWGGTLPKCATRIEIQISRAWLRRFGIDSPADLHQKGSDVIQRQLTNWFRMTTTRVESEKKTQGRMKTDPLWTGLASVMANWFGRPQGELTPVDRKKVHPIKACKQGFGHLRSALLQQGFVLGKFQDFHELVSVLLDLAYPTHDERQKFVEDYHKRSSEYLA